MNKNKQRIAIAKSQGITTYPNHQWEERDERRYFVCPRCAACVGWGDYSKNKGITLEPCAGTERDYPNDLNAMREVEQNLSSDQQDEYAEILLGNLDEAFCGLAGTHEHVFAVATLSSEQRAESYLRMIGKWDESNPTSKGE